MKKKILMSLVVFAVFLAGCTQSSENVATGNVPFVDTTQQSITDTGTADSDLGDQDVQDISSDMDQVDEILS